MGVLHRSILALVTKHLTLARVAEVLAVAWGTVNDAVLAEGRRLLIEDKTRSTATL